jgi:serine/threonine protein phosphatase PrpC
MEDSHIAHDSLSNSVALFGVFDGHGGSEVALYVKQNFTPTLLKNQNFVEKKYEKALYETFLHIDE